MKSFLNISKVLLVIITFALSTSAMAQRQGGQRNNGPRIPNEQQIEKMIQELEKELSLSEEQSIKVQAVYTAHFKKMEEKTKNGRPDREEMQEMRADFEKDVNEHLTKEQQVAHAKLLEERRQQRKQKR
ncbi:hypothetical protein [Carboxylicivirga sp. M1479]|uniref:hypothetical protein n=1 Tax=Carboxylicivirga sp. M1479 TaxID=2594476 RepID=UPI001178C2C6|nr:hypothetical protein [Carboxylicivirga sp. M1479]TRX71099.1 hypothetical protein FNN09_07720 [Carboxylicivirga sp. M1479]